MRILTEISNATDRRRNGTHRIFCEAVLGAEQETQHLSITSEPAESRAPRDPAQRPGIDKAMGPSVLERTNSSEKEGRISCRRHW